MTVSEKVAYLKGLAKGMELEKLDSKEAKLIGEIIDVLEDVSLAIVDIEDNARTLGEEIDVLSDDLADVEEVVFGEEKEDECCDCQYSIKCPNCEKSLKDMKDIDNCPYCGFELTHIFINKVAECTYCHRSLDGMEHIGNKCPYCGNLIEN